jgi:hypothetical protein
MGDSGLLMRSHKLDSRKNGEDYGDESCSSDDENDVSAITLPAASDLDPATTTSPSSSAKCSLIIDSVEANAMSNAVHKTSIGNAGEFPVPEREKAPTRSPGALPLPLATRQGSGRGKMIAPSPKGNAKQILEDAMREMEPLLPPIRMASRDPGGTSRQPSKEPGSTGSLFANPNKSTAARTPG